MAHVAHLPAAHLSDHPGGAAALMGVLQPGMKVGPLLLLDKVEDKDKKGVEGGEEEETQWLVSLRGGGGAKGDMGLGGEHKGAGEGLERREEVGGERKS